jgi:hypothetical protein
MPGNSTDDSEPLPVSSIVPGMAHLRQYPAHNLVACQPQGVLDDQLLDEIGEWLSGTSNKIQRIEVWRRQ